jgi:cell division protein FtsN
MGVESRERRGPGGNTHVNDAYRSVAHAGIVVSMLVLAAGCSGRQSDWETARKANTAEAYTEFLKRYPDGDFTSQAQSRLIDLKEETDWNAALATDNAQGYQQFIERHPDGARADEAHIRVQNLNLAQAPVDAQVAVVSKPTSGTVNLPSKPAAAQPSTGFRVQLGAFSSATRARSEWQHAVKAHPAELSGLSYTIDKTAVGNTTLYRLQTSAVPESKARATCDALTSTKQACVVVLP